MKFVVRILQEPLLHFLVLAAGLFVLARVFSEAPAVDDPDSIVVSQQRIKSLILTFNRTWQRPPTRQELDGLIEDYIKEEVLYREGLAMGLDRDDTMIRRRIRQKMEFVAEDLADTIEPTEEELRKYLDDHPDSFREEQRATFRHIYLKPERRGASLQVDAQQLLADLRGDGDNDSVDPVELGDPFLLPHYQEDLREAEVAGQFGPGFAARVFALEAGEWSGPIESAYGVHLVLVEKRTEGRVPKLDDVREAVRREWFAARRFTSKDEFYLALRQKYEVVVEKPDFNSSDAVAQESE